VFVLLFCIGINFFHMFICLWLVMYRSFLHVLCYLCDCSFGCCVSMLIKNRVLLLLLLLLLLLTPFSFLDFSSPSILILLPHSDRISKGLITLYTQRVVKCHHNKTDIVKLLGNKCSTSILPL
jgi:hypothetical protein